MAISPVLASGAVARRLEIEFVGDRLAGARLAQAYSVLAPERRRVTGNEGSGDERQRRGADGQSRIAAIYARVSSERQRQEQTIASQTVALRELAEQRDLVVPEEFVFEDDGFSGANLQRPALEQLRDRAFDGCFEVVLCHAPDRLARRYAYQVLLLEELARGGIEVVFAKEPERSGSPEDELLRQFQGMIAEYERAQIAERCRRGKLHRARAGAVSVLSGAPYGYRYVKKTEHADAFYEIDELEAPIVREIFDRYVEQRESIVQIGRSLTEQGVPTRTGTPHWGSSTIWAILRNPAYTGHGGLRSPARDRRAGEADAPTRQRGQAFRSLRLRARRARALAADPGAGADHRRAARARSGAARAQQPALAAQHAQAVAAARDPRLPRVRPLLLPQLDAQQDRERAPLLPLLGR